MKSETVTNAYARRQRRRAEKIIAATGCYSAKFRGEVRSALDKTPHKLPTLFREARQIDERLESAGRSVHADMRAAGCPVRQSRPKPMGRSPKNILAREAEEIESVFVQYQANELTADMTERAELISAILYDISGEAQVDANHPQLNRAYYLAIQDAVYELESHISRERVWAAMNQIRDLMNGCSDARFDEIHTIYHGSPDEQRRARAIELGDVVPYDAALDSAKPVAPPVETDKLVAVRETLSALEDVPENEAVAFRLETQIFNLVHAGSDEEWPDVIGGDA